MQAVFITKRPDHQGRGRLKCQKTVFRRNVLPLRLSERHYAQTGFLFMGGKP